MDPARQQFKDKIYLDMAKKVAELSKDENTKIGCIIMSKEGTPVSHGYNGTVAGFDDRYIPHNREKAYLSYWRGPELIKFTDNKHNYMIHAERNAIRFADPDKLEGSTLYINNLPCKDCALAIASHKIAKVMVSTTKVDEGSTVGNDSEVTEFIFAQAGIVLVINGKEKFLHRSNKSQIT